MTPCTNPHLVDTLNWLVKAAIDGRSERGLTNGIGRRLVAMGVPVDRISMGSEVLDPVLRSRQFIWRADEGTEKYLHERGLSETEGWRVKHVGSCEGLPAELSAALVAAEEATAGNTGLHVNLAVGYGGRSEITAAMRSVIAEHQASGGTLDTLAERLTPEMIGEHLWTRGQADPDLVIRTSGEQRLSDFMIWQSAHSEFYFVEALYPDLREVDLLRALRDYSRRQRRMGR